MCTAYSTQIYTDYGYGIPSEDTPAQDNVQTMASDIANVGANGVPFYTPEQSLIPGLAIDPQPSGKPVPKLFTPLKIRGITLPNRIWVSPMCQYSAHEGFHTPWHIAHYGGMAQRGPGLIMIEATAVQATGRITPQDSGIWLDAHVETLKRHVEFAHSQKRLIGIQLAHAGRKASTVAPWVSSEDGVLAIEQVGGWLDDVIGPNSESYRDGYPTPRTMTLAEIDRVKRDFVKGAQRAIQAGFDVIELHFAHGYLISSFLTPAVNQRTDRYGGNFENRTRFALEIVAAVREVMPQTMPLFARISSTDWLDNSPEWTGESWTVDGSIRFASLLADHGVDVLDVSSGGNHKQQNIIGGPGYQAPFAKKIKKAVGERILVSSVGSIQTGVLAEELIRGGRDGSDTPLDLIAAGRSFQKNPGLVWAWADELDVSVNLAKQIGWGFGGRVSEKSTSMSIP